jgi:hypothetical protein
VQEEPPDSRGAVTPERRVQPPALHLRPAEPAVVVESLYGLASDPRDCVERSIGKSLFARHVEEVEQGVGYARRPVCVSEVAFSAQHLYPLRAARSGLKIVLVAR